LLVIKKEKKKKKNFKCLPGVPGRFLFFFGTAGLDPEIELSTKPFGSASSAMFPSIPSFLFSCSV